MANFDECGMRKIADLIIRYLQDFFTGQLSGARRAENLAISPMSPLLAFPGTSRQFYAMI
jgi:hypothetical protein